MTYTVGNNALKSFPNYSDTEVGFVVADEERPPEVDNMGEPIDWNDVIREWKTPQQVARMKKMTQQNVTYLCREGQLRAVYFESKWRIHPQAARDYTKSERTGKPPQAKE